MQKINEPAPENNSNKPVAQENATAIAVAALEKRIKQLEDEKKNETAPAKIINLNE